jgi:hypothetical protein
LVAACKGGLTNPQNLVSLSDNNGYDNSKAIKIAANNSSSAADIYFKELFDFNFDCFELYYNVPQGQANFFFRLYLDTSYSKRAYLSFSSNEIKLSGTGFLRIPFNSTYMQGGGGATAADIDNAVTAKGIGLYVNSGSAEFYIDNIKLYAQTALPESQDKLQAASVRNIMNGLEDGDYLLVVQKSYSVNSHKTLYPVVSKTFNVSSNVSDLSETEFENLITDGNKYIYTIYKQGTIVAMGKLEPAASLLFNFQNYGDIDDFKEACAEGVYDPNNSLSISAAGGFGDSAALKIASKPSASDIIFKRLWDFPQFDYFEFYYNVPTGLANFYLRLYLDTSTTYSNRAYIDFSNGNLKLSGSGIIRIPVNSIYMSVNGTDAQNVVSSKVKGLGFYVNANSAEFYIDNIRLSKASALPAEQNVTAENALRTIIEGMAQGEGYRLVIEKSYIVSSPHKALQPVVNKVFDINENGSTLAQADFEDIIPDTVANYIYTVYNAAGNIVHYGTFIITV